MTDPSPYPRERTGIPRWVKMSGIVALLVVLLLVVLMLTGVFGGGHGPRRHGSASVAVTAEV